MTKINIASVGFRLSSIKYLDYFGKDSFTDYDVLIVNPKILTNYYGIGSHRTSQYEISDKNAIHNLLTKFKDRKTEILNLLNAGKLIITFLSPPYNIHYRIFRSNNSGNIRDYDWLDLDSNAIFTYLVEAKGTGIKLIDNLHLFNPFYRFLKNEIVYSAYINKTPEEFKKIGDAFITNMTNQVVGFSVNKQNGMIAFLPDFNQNSENNEIFRSVVTRVSKEYFGSTTTTDPPNWIDEYQIPGMNELIIKRMAVQEKINELEEKKLKIDLDIEHKNNFKMLLYETGIALQEIVLEAFRLMGFNAATIGLKNTDLDVVLESVEGRIIAEVEGRDSEAIHKGKIDQLLSAINQDEDISGTIAEGILIGNHYRLQKPVDRKDPFSSTVQDLANLRNFSLLTTEELYSAVVFILDHPEDPELLKTCREEIFKSKGRLIKFPLVREIKTTD
jgi:hypothetical protein